MSDEVPVTGVADAVLVDVLLGLGVSVTELVHLSREQRLERLGTAAVARRIPPEQAERLRAIGLLPPDKR